MSMQERVEQLVEALHVLEHDGTEAVEASPGDPGLQEITEADGQARMALGTMRELATRLDQTADSLLR